MTPWLQIHRGNAPLIVSLPHTGTEIPPEIEARMASPRLARKDADWWVDRLYDFAVELDATLIRTAISRSVIDVNRDPSGASLYPGQATTGLCPTTSFDGESLYKAGAEPDQEEISERRREFFDPYHDAMQGEIHRLRAVNNKIVLYDAHSIRSNIPRLFEGALPHFNIGNNRGATCADKLTAGIEHICGKSNFLWVTNGRFIGGWTTRHYGSPERGVHAVQMELAMRGYLDEPAETTPHSWPTAFDPARAGAMRAVLREILQSCLAFAKT
jgi:formiminoglutamase